MRVSIRSLLAAGVSLTAVSTSIPWAAAQSSITASAAPEIRLSAAVSPLLPSVQAAAVSEYSPADNPTPYEGIADEQAIGGFASAGDFIINAYNAIEPWVAWGFELVQWGMSFVPLLWWVAPGVDLAYFTIEPVVQSLVYSFAFLIDGNFSLIGPTIQAGLQEAAYNFVQYSIYWVESIVPFPPLPPWPPFPFAAAATAGPAAVTRAAATVAAETAETAPAATDTADPADAPATDSAAPATELSNEAEGDATAPTTDVDAQAETTEVDVAAEPTGVAVEADATDVADQVDATDVEVATEATEPVTPAAPRAGKRTAVHEAQDAQAAPSTGPGAGQDESAAGRSGGKSGASAARSGR